METNEWRIDKSKITDYLLNENHPEGNRKLSGFSPMGLVGKSGNYFRIRFGTCWKSERVK